MMVEETKGGGSFDFLHISEIVKQKKYHVPRNPADTDSIHKDLKNAAMQAPSDPLISVILSEPSGSQQRTTEYQALSR